VALIHQVKSPKIGTELPLAKPVLYTGLNLSTPIISAADGGLLATSYGGHQSALKL
jgi:hypothetical protein